MKMVLINSTHCKSHAALVQQSHSHARRKRMKMPVVSRIKVPGACTRPPLVYTGCQTDRLKTTRLVGTWILTKAMSLLKIRAPAYYAVHTNNGTCKQVIKSGEARLAEEHRGKKNKAAVDGPRIAAKARRPCRIDWPASTSGMVTTVRSPEPMVN